WRHWSRGQPHCADLRTRPWAQVFTRHLSGLRALTRWSHLTFTLRAGASTADPGADNFWPPRQVDLTRP
ncbi:MAG: hypothetical protein M3O70_17995, partial [Actinomycetota bacterium]|nr:hypothetical protein [Actinomycetota bacterium]